MPVFMTPPERLLSPWMVIYKMIQPIFRVWLRRCEKDTMLYRGGAKTAMIHLYGEMHVFLPAYLYGRGAKVAEIPVIHHARQFGVSKHYFMKAIKDLFDLMTIKFLANMSGRPLLFFGGIGVFSIAAGFVTG